MALRPSMYFNRALARSMASVGTLMFTGDCIAQQFETVTSRGVVSPHDRVVPLPAWLGSSASSAGSAAAEEAQQRRQWNASRSLRMVRFPIK